MSPEPLSPAAVARVVADAEPDAAHEFALACHRASGGVPLYVHELLASARADGIRPDRAGAERLPGITPESVRRLVLGRLTPLGDRALALARACATLDARADIRTAGRLAGLAPADSVAAADRLCESGIFRARRPLGFVHPIMQTVVQTETPPGQRSRLHRAAATLLAEDGAPPQEVGAHLLPAEPMDDPGVVERLRAAAGDALRDGAPSSALRFLERALEEPPPGDALVHVLHDAAHAAALCGRADRAIDLARRALASTPEPVQRARTLAVLARGAYAEYSRSGTRLTWEPDVRPIVDLARASADELPPDQRALRYELEAAAATLLFARIAEGVRMPREDVARLNQLAQEATGETAGEREILGTAATWGALTATASCSDVLDLALRSLEDGSLTRELGGGATYDSAIEILTMCDSHAEADRHLAEAARHARRYGVSSAAALIAAYRANEAWLSGALERTFDFAADAAAHLRESGDDAYVDSVARGATCGALVARGELGAALSTAGAIEHPRLQQHALGIVAAARGDHAAAAEHLRVAQESFDRRGIWRSSGPLRAVRPDLAVSLAAIGEHDEARAVVGAELEVARRFGAASCIAEALRAKAAVEQDPEPLREAAVIIRGSEARLVEAGVQLALGRATGGAKALERALGIAERCGAHALSHAARLALAESDRSRV